MNKKKSRIIIWVISFAILVSICVINTIPTEAKSMSNKQIVKEYCKHHYKGYKIQYFTEWNEKIITHRANKRIVYVQIEKSISSGKIDSCNGRYWGYIKGQHYYKTWYNKKVKKDKTVTSYYIYNPYTNYEDDIVAVIDNGKIR